MGEERPCEREAKWQLIQVSVITKWLRTFMKPPRSGGEALTLEKRPPSSLMSLILAVPAAAARVLENSTLFLASDQNQYFREKRRREKELNKSSDKHNKYWKDEILQAECSRKHSR